MRPWMLALALAACPKPIAAVPTMATGTKGLVICWNDEEKNADQDDRAFLTALRKRLEGAGYDLSSRICDVTLGYHLSSVNDRGDKGFTEASLTVSGAHGIVDKIKLSFDEPTDVPTSEPDRLAILLVNAMNKSEKLAAFKRRLHEEEHETEPEEDPSLHRRSNLIQ